MSEMRKVVRKQPDRNVKTRRKNIEEPGKISGRMEDKIKDFHIQASKFSIAWTIELSLEWIVAKMHFIKVHIF
jgi:hypothetical protein